MLPLVHSYEEMMMKRVKKSEEPWKKKEPGGRVSQRSAVQRAHSVMERAEMEESATQKVTIVINKSLLALPGQYYSFTVKMKNPLRKDEIDEKMKAAFPELEWEEF